MAIFRAHRCSLHVHSLAEAAPSIDSAASQLLLDTKDLIQLGQTLRSGWSTTLDLASSDTNDNVGDGNIFGLAGTMGHHDTPASSVGVLGGLNRFSQSADLVDFEEQSVAGFGVDGTLDAFGVGHGQVVTTSD
jgi:hypothetical protein